MKKFISIIACFVLLVGLSGCSKSVPTGVNTISDNDSIVETELDHPVIIDFSDNWCGPCQAFKPSFEKAAEEYAGKVEFITVDVDKNPEMSQKYNVLSIPTVIYLAPGKEPRTKVGLMTYEEFKTSIDEFLKD